MLTESQRDALEKDPTWRTLSQQFGGNAATVAIFTLLYALLVYFGHHFKESTQQLTVLWPAAGLMLTALWLAPWKLWPLFIALQVAVEFALGSMFQEPFRPGLASLFILANSIDAIVGALIVRSMGERHSAVHAYRVMHLVSAAAGGAAVSATLGAWVAVQSYQAENYWHQWQLWWAGNWLGTLTVAPVVYTWAVPTRRLFKALQVGNHWVFPLFAAVTLPVTWWVFSVPASEAASLLQTPVIPLVLLVGAALRLPPRWAMLLAALTIFVAAQQGTRGAGPYVVESAFVRVLQLQMYLAMLATVTFLVTVFFVETRITLERLRESEGRYRNFVELSTEAVWRVELTEPMPVSLPLEEQREWLRANAHVAECNRTFEELVGADAVRDRSLRPWRGDVPWTAIFEQHLELAARNNFSMDGLRFTVPNGARPRTFLTSFSGIVVHGYLERIWGVARDISEIVDLNTRLLREQERLKSYARQIMTAEERARRATAVDLHDGITQSLVGMAMTLEVAREQATPEVQVLIDETRANLRQVQERTRNMIADLSPPGLYDLGLCPALQWLSVYFRGHDKLQVALDCKVREDAVQMELRVLIFKLVRELLRNVVKHAGVDVARVTVRGDTDQVRIEVVDTGKGFEWQMDLFGARVGGFGLWSIADRVSEMDGEFKVDTAPGRGARFELIFPLRRARVRDGNNVMQQAG